MAGRVLVVDDSKHTRDILKFLLESRQFTVVVAENGDEALERLGEGTPDLIILDAVMPGRSGYEVCAKIKGSETTRSIPVLMLTAQSESAGDTVKRWKPELRPDRVMAKPFKVQELLESIGSFLAA